MSKCPCNSQKEYTECCEPYLLGKQFPEAPEGLMRSRYTAYTMANIDYIKATMRGKASLSFQELDAKQWAKRVIWIKLDVIHSEIEDPEHGYVEFEATFVDKQWLRVMHEKSEFIRTDNRWYYIDGTQLPANQIEQLVFQNKPCPCGNTRKFKHCHGKA